MSNLLNKTFQKHLNLLKKHLNEGSSNLVLEYKFTKLQAIEVLKNYGVINAGNLSPDELKNAYRDLSKKHHPDVGGNQEDFKKIVAAYDTLKNSSSSFQKPPPSSQKPPPSSQKPPPSSQKPPPSDQQRQQSTNQQKPPTSNQQRPSSNTSPNQQSSNRRTWVDDFEEEKRRIDIANQRMRREKAAKEREDAIRSDAEFKRNQKMKQGLIYILLAGFAVASIGAYIGSMNDNVQSGDLESGKEVTVKSPNIDGKTPEERLVLSKLKPKMPSHFKVKYNPNLGKGVDMDFKKVMVTVSDLNLAKALVNQGFSNLKENNTQPDISLKAILQIFKTQGVDGLETAAEKIVTTK